MVPLPRIVHRPRRRSDEARRCAIGGRGTRPTQARRPAVARPGRPRRLHMPASPRITLATVSIAAAVLAAAGCGGKDPAPRAPAAAAHAPAGEVAAVAYPGLQHRHYRYGPIQITPGQNTIVYRPTAKK